MGHFIRGFDMHGGKIIACGQRIQGTAHLALIVGIQVAGCPFHMRRFQPGEPRNAPYKRHGADHRPPVAILLAEGGQADGGGGAPGPDHVGGQEAQAHAPQVDGVLLEHLVAAKHQGADIITQLAGRCVVRLSYHVRQMCFDGLFQHVMRLGQADAGQVSRAGVHHADMPEGIRHRDRKPGILHQRRKAGIGQQTVHQGGGFLTMDIAAVVAVDHQPSVLAGQHGAQVDAEADGSLRQGDAHACGLQHAAARVIGLRRVAEDAQDGGVAPRGHAVRHRERAAAEASRAAVEGGKRQRLQRRFAGELWQARVGHAVADDQYILHPESLPFLSIADRVTRPR